MYVKSRVVWVIQVHEMAEINVDCANGHDLAQIVDANCRGKDQAEVNWDQGIQILDASTAGPYKGAAAE